MHRGKILLALLFFVPDNGTWVLRKNQDDIRVYTRSISTSDFKELKCTTRVKSSMSAIVKLLIDVDHFKGWIYKCTEATLIKKVSAREVISYQLFDAPWPVDDRDVVANCYVTQDEKTKIVVVRSVVANVLIPEKKGIVRIKNFRTTYTLTPKGNGWIEIDYELGTEPGGSVPAWLANMVMVNGPFTSQQAMSALLQTSYFKSAKLGFLVEP
ncbi:MAG: START domain-containing protein [Bacteroidia bacterium]